MGRYSSLHRLGSLAVCLVYVDHLAEAGQPLLAGSAPMTSSGPETFEAFIVHSDNFLLAHDVLGYLSFKNYPNKPVWISGESLKKKNSMLAGQRPSSSGHHPEAIIQRPSSSSHHPAAIIHHHTRRGNP
jgi:hypothetical protein